MQKRFALLFVLIFVLVLVPAYYPPEDALRQNSPLCSCCSQLYTATGTLSDFNHDQSWTGVSLSWVISYLLPQYVPSSPAARAPPA